MHIGVLSLPGNFHCEKWAKALAAAGAQVTVFSFEGGKNFEGTTVKTVELVPPVVWGGRYRYPSYYLSAGRLRYELERRKVDVLHPLHLTPFGSWGVWSGFKPMIAAAMGADVLEYPPQAAHLQQPGVRTWREANVQHTPLAKLKARWLNRFFRARVQQVLTYADIITGDNMPLVDAMRNWFTVDPEKIRLLRWGLEPELFDFTDDVRQAVRAQFGAAPGARVVLSPRGANALYQADIIIAAFEELLHSGPPGYHYIMLGAGYDLAGAVQQKALQLEAQYPNFRFVREQLPRLAVYRLWSITDVFISAPIYDGYSAAVAEGRYAGAIPVLNNIPGNTEIIQHGYNGMLVHPFTPRQLVATLQDVHQHFDQYKHEFAPRNRAWILEHSVLHANAAKLVHWADALLAGRPRLQ
jgi:glycosyltransferase involved in cell wall biosynthesis